MFESPTLPKSKLAWLRPILIFSLFVLVFQRFWFHTIIAQDSFVYFAPNKYHLAQALKAWTLPFWNPWQFMGMPFAAEVQAGCFYPLNLLFVFLEFGVAHRLFILLHYPLAAISMDLFLRQRGLDRDSALTGALAFALSGYLIGQHALVRMVLGAAWAPLAFYCVGRAWSGRLIWAVGAGAVLTLQVLAGDPETAAVTGALCLLLVLGEATSRREPGRGLAIAAVMGIFSLALSAVQVAPTYEMMRLSTRGGGLPLAEAQVFSYHPAGLIEWLWPTPFGTHWPQYNYWGQFTLDAKFSMVPWSASNYVGLPVLFLAAVGLLRGRRRWKGWVGAGALLFLLLALGRHTPVYSWFHATLPVFDSFRYPVKYLAWVTGLIGVAAALGMETLRRDHEENPSALARSAWVHGGLILAIATAAYLLGPGALSRLQANAPNAPARLAALPHLYQSGLHWAIINLACGLSWWLVSRQVLSLKRGVQLFILVMAFDLWRVNVSLMPAGPPEIFTRTSAAAAALEPGGGPSLGRYRIFREGMEFHDVNPDSAPENPYLRQTFWELDSLKRNLEGLYGFEDIVSAGSYELKDGLILFKRGMGPDLMGLYNVRYIIAAAERGPLQSVKSKVMARDRQRDFAIIELLEAWPRSYWVPTARRAKDEAEAISLLPALDLKQTVVLTAGPELKATELGEDAPPAEAGGAGKIAAAAITRYEPDLVVAELETPAPGWLVLSDRDYPGWTATVDGAPAKIYRANVLGRAVRLAQPGRHQVQFRFRPRSLALGAVVSLVGLAVAVVWGLWPSRPAGAAVKALEGEGRGEEA